MLPEIPSIRESLAALSVEEAGHSSQDMDRIVICDKLDRVYSDGSLQADRSIIVLKQAASATIRLGALVKKIADELGHSGHAHVAAKNLQRESLASKLLAAATIIGRSLREDTLSSMNQVLKSIVEARITQWAVLVSPAVDLSRYRFGDFEFGVIDSDLLRQRSERAGSDFAALSGDKLRKQYSLCRDSRSIGVANIKPLLRSIGSMPSAKLLYRVLDDYFGVLAQAEQRQFLLDLDRQQAIYGAVGLGTISSDALKKFGHYMFWITIFNVKKRNEGWVVPYENYPIISTTNPKALADGYHEIRSSLNLGDWGSRGLDDLLQTYVEYLYAARSYEEDGRVEEALLHSVFALDLLLGGSAMEPLTSHLAERVAMLSHLVLNEDFESIARFVRDTYDMRSAYVHRGKFGRLSEETKETLVNHLRRLKAICLVVLGTACFVRSQPWCDTDDARKVWLGRIDILRTKRGIGQGLDPTDVRELGLDRIELGDGKTSFVSIRS
jgi:hypothetical protein